MTELADKGRMMPLSQADRYAGQIVEALRPHCERIEVAGSVRRRRPEVGDLEVVVIPKPYGVGLFESGLVAIVNRWPKVKGNLGPGCRYTQRMVPLVAPLEMDLSSIAGDAPKAVGHVKLDLFFAEPRNWGLILAIRTGSADYSHRVLARGWRRAGYKSWDGILHSSLCDKREVPEEEDLFRLIGIPWIPPEDREVKP